MELADLRTQLSARDTELATARAECRAALGTLAGREQTAAALRQSDEQTTRAFDEARTAQAAALATVHARYEGLSKRLLQETEHQRHALATERERLTTQLADAQTRVAAIEGLRERLLDEVAGGRDAHRQAAAEAAALSTVVTEQRRTVAALQTQQTIPTQAPRRPARLHPATPGYTRRAAYLPATQMLVEEWSAIRRRHRSNLRLARNARLLKMVMN